MIAISLLHKAWFMIALLIFFPRWAEKFSSNAPRKQNASCKRKTCSALKVTRQSKGHDEFKRRQCIYQTIYVAFYIRFYYERSLSRVMTCLSLINFKFMAIENLDLFHILLEAFFFCRLIFFLVVSCDSKFSTPLTLIDHTVREYI